MFDLRQRTVKWEQHLDLSTDSTSFRAHAYAPPTVVDLDKYVLDKLSYYLHLYPLTHSLCPVHSSIRAFPHLLTGMGNWR